jgi:DNA-binding NarL/FixJ family response regulator
MAAIALIADLVMQSHVSGAADRAQVQLEIALSADALVSKAGTNQPQLVIIDLAEPALDIEQLVPRLKAQLPPTSTILAFGPHVHRQRLAAAERAGCDVVLSRGAFHAQTEAILKTHGE